MFMTSAADASRQYVRCELSQSNYISMRAELPNCPGGRLQSTYHSFLFELLEVGVRTHRSSLLGTDVGTALLSRAASAWARLYSLPPTSQMTLAAEATIMTGSRNCARTHVGVLKRNIPSRKSNLMPARNNSCDSPNQAIELLKRHSSNHT